MRRIKSLFSGLIIALIFILLAPPIRGFASSLIDLPSLFSKKEVSLFYQISPDERFLYEITKPNFKAFFGNKLKNNSHLVKIEHDGKSLTFSFLKSKHTEVSTESALLEETPSATPTPTTDLSPDLSSPRSSTPTTTFSFTSTITTIPESLKDIQKEIASISQEVSQIEKKFAQIKTEVKENIFKQTFLTREKDKEKIKNLEISPEVDITYQTEDDKIKEEIILKDKTAANSFIFELNLVNLIPQFNGEVWEFRDPKNDTPVFSFEKPFMDDSAGSHSNDVSLDIYQENNKNFIKITANRNWLLSPERVYPVVIDPTVKTSVPANSTAGNFQRKAFYDPINGTYWVGIRIGDAATNTSYVYFYYSKNGRAWTYAGDTSRPEGTGASAIRNEGYAWSLWPAIEGGVMYVYLIADWDYQMRVYKGTLSSTSITWSSATILDIPESGNVYRLVNIAKSSNGYVWVIFSYYYTAYSVRVAQGSSINSISGPWTFTSLSSLNVDQTIILPNGVNNNNMIAIYTASWVSTFRFRTYNGTTWATEADVATNRKAATPISCLADVSYYIPCLYIDTDDEVRYTKYTTSWSTPTALTSATTSTDVSLAIDAGNDNLYAFYRQGSNYLYRMFDGSSWQPQRDPGFTEGTSPTFLTTNFSRDNRQGDEGRIFGIWSNTDSSNSVVFARIFEVSASIEEMRHGKFFHEGDEQKMTW